jgi:surface antigen
VLKSISSALLASVFTAALAAPAFAGQVYGNYGQGQYQGPPPNYHDCGDDAAAGTVVGGILGGVIGNQFGHGGGRTAATIGGVILGGIAGNAIARDACKNDHADAYYYNNSYYDAFNDPNEGREYNWRNPYSNNYGYVTPGEYYEDGYQDYSGPCREFEQRVYIDGRAETATGVACRQPDGTWRIVSGS